MSTFVPNKVFLRGVLLHHFNLKKKAVESHRLLVEAYGEHALAERTCQKWFARFRRGKFDLEDEVRPGPPPKFDDKELEARLDEDPSQTQEELAKTLGVTQPTICQRLKLIREKEDELNENTKRKKRKELSEADTDDLLKGVKKARFGCITSVEAHDICKAADTHSCLEKFKQKRANDKHIKKVNQQCIKTTNTVKDELN